MHFFLRAAFTIAMLCLDNAVGGAGVHGALPASRPGERFSGALGVWRSLRWKYRG
ncbi:hypothetical protein NT01EI_2199 [Edwardsiella ictaluri 93-146]|uniref:Uncharacterized protein n=1 Tax=Edwardsiella ictaluri (strain 93-146) TaxID=634503 RepID=C5BFU6_EDWI9|nr:hypothetical protein NT01EI_2199 [Edwardsiella ictaluri 93-146]